MIESGGREAYIHIERTLHYFNYFNNFNTLARPANDRGLIKGRGGVKKGQCKQSFYGINSRLHTVHHGEESVYLLTIHKQWQRFQSFGSHEEGGGGGGLVCGVL